MVSVQKLLSDLQKFVEQIVKDLSGDKIPGIPSANDIPDMCGGTVTNPASSEECKKFICDSMLNGLSSLHWLNWENKYPHVSKRRSLEDKVALIGKDKSFNDIALEHIFDAHSQLSENLRNIFLGEGSSPRTEFLGSFAQKYIPDDFSARKKKQMH